MNSLNIPGTLESREVAEMVDKRHDHLMRDIGGYIGHINELADPKVGASDFFVTSAYIDSTGRTLPCYLITKKGCELIANKLTGAKGVQFTARYVQRFNDMEQAQQITASGETEKLLRARAALLNAKTRQYTAIIEAFGDTPGIDPAFVYNFRLLMVRAIMGVDVSGLLTSNKKRNATGGLDDGRIYDL